MEDDDTILNVDGDDDQDAAINDVFEQISQSQSVRSSQLVAQIPIIPPPTVNRRRRRAAAAKGGEARRLPEPGLDKPIDTSKKKNELLEFLKQVKSSKKDCKLLTQKKCFDQCFLDDLGNAANLLDLPETGELIHTSSMVYGVRVDATYSEAYTTHCQLMPSLAKYGVVDKDGNVVKKTKAELKAQQATATQSINLQKLQEISRDSPEDEESARNSKTPELFPNESQKGERKAGGEDAVGEGSDAEDGDAALPTQKDQPIQKNPLEIPLDTNKITFSNTLYRDVIQVECERRRKALDLKRGLNPMLIEDEKKFRMAPAPILNNEYYQIATARFKDFNAGGMLTYNAKVTHNARMTMMHKRMENWRDIEAVDMTPPTKEFRLATSGLIDNALAEKPRELPNNLFDPQDRVTITGYNLDTKMIREQEEKSRARWLGEDDHFNYLDNDDQIEDDDEDNEIVPPARLGSSDKKVATAASSEVTQSQTDSASERVEKEEVMVTPRINNNGDEGEGEEQETEADILVQPASVHKRRKLKNGLKEINKVLGDDTIPNGPTLAATDLAAKFQKILFDKVSMGSNVHWKRGAQSEELQADPSEIHDDTFGLESCGVDDELRDLDFIWNAKIYKKNVTVDEAARMIEEKEAEDRTTIVSGFGVTRRSYLRPGHYELFGEADDYANPDIPADEYAHLSSVNDPIAREVYDDSEMASLERRSPIHDESMEPDLAEGPIHVQAHGSTNNDLMGGGFDDFDNGGPSDDDFFGSNSGQFSPVGRRGIAQTGEDSEQQVDCFAEAGMVVNITEPSRTVTQVGKQDDSHWKLAKSHPDNMKVKKERKKKDKKKEDEIKPDYFSFTSNRNIPHIPLVDHASDLLKNPNSLQLPESRYEVVPQFDYDPSMYYRPFLMPEKLFSKWCIRVPRDDEDGDGDSQERRRRSHYARMLEASVGERVEDGGIEDAYIAFLTTFSNYGTVATVKEMELEDRVRAGEINREEADAQLAQDDNMGDNFYDGGAMGDDDEGGGGIDDVDFVHVPTEEKRRLSRARSMTRDYHGYGMDEDDEEGECEVDGQIIDLKHIKLDTVAMRCALSDVLTNPLMVQEKLKETLEFANQFLPDNSQEFDNVPDLEATLGGVPDCLEVTRALFATSSPEKHNRRDVTDMYREMSMAPGAVDDHEDNTMNKSDHIELNGLHTLKSTFTCLPARLANKASEVTVASTIAMILHLANENNLDLRQKDQQEREGTPGWMNDFEVVCEDDADGSKVAAVKKRVSNAVLSQLEETEENHEEMERQRLEVLARVAAEQKEEAKKKKKRRSDEPGPSSAMNDTFDSDGSEIDVTISNETTIIEKKKTSDTQSTIRKRENPKKAVRPESAGSNTSPSPSSKITSSVVNKKPVIDISDDDEEEDCTILLEDTIVVD